MCVLACLLVSCSYIADDSITDPSKVERLILCCGQIYYDLHAERDRLMSEGQDGAGESLRVSRQGLFHADEGVYFSIF